MESTPPYTKDITLKEAIEVELDQSLFKISNEEYGRLTFYIWPFDSNNVEVSAKMASNGDGLYFFNDGENVTFDYFYQTRQTRITNNNLNGRQTPTKKMIGTIRFAFPYPMQNISVLKRFPV